jgi:hypothetical protein
VPARESELRVAAQRPKDNGAQGGSVRRNDNDRVGPRSWYWSNKTKVLVAAVIIVALLVIMILVNPGPGSGYR